MSNGRVEQIFSTLKLVKTERCSCLGENSLDDLVRISVDGPPLSKWDATAVRLWWGDKQRRNIGDSRNSSSSNADDSCTGSYELDLDDWDSFLQ